MVHRSHLTETDPVDLATADLVDLLEAVQGAGSLDERAAEALDFALRQRCLEALRTGDREELTELSGGISRILHPRRVTELAEFEAPFAARWSAWRDLVDDRVSTLDEARPKQMLEREHVRKALEWVSSVAQSRRAPTQADLRTHLGLRKANLTRLVTLLVEHGLLTRSRAGKVNKLALTDAARQLLAPTAHERHTVQAEHVGRRGLLDLVDPSQPRLQ